MTKITYLAGEGHPAQVVWKDVTLKANVACEVRDPEVIERARDNRFFSVEDMPAKGRGTDPPRRHARI